MMMVINADKQVLLTSCQDEMVRAFVINENQITNVMKLPTPNTYITKFLKYNENAIICGLENGKFKGWNLTTNIMEDKDGHICEIVEMIK